MKKPFKKGDRVRAYCHYGNYNGTVIQVDLECVGPGAEPIKGMLLVKNRDGVSWPMHPRQCVRLKKKEPSVRVTRKQLEEVWDKHEINSYFTYSTFKDFCKALGLPEEHPACVGRDED